MLAVPGTTLEFSRGTFFQNLPFKNKNARSSGELDRACLGDAGYLLIQRNHYCKKYGEGLTRLGFKQGVLTENLWPKLFSEAPRCAPLRLPWYRANERPSASS